MMETEMTKIKRVSRLKTSLTVIFLLLILWGSAIQTGVSFLDLKKGLPNMGTLLGEMFPPEWSYFSYITKPMLATIRMAVIGTTFGAIIAIPVILLSSSNVVKHSLIYLPSRFIMNLIRTIPELLLAALFVPIFGIGEIAGIFAITIFSFGVIAKLAYESVEAIDPGPLEAMTAVGANKIQWIFFGVIPQVTAQFMSYFLYSFEINIRAAAILGYVGAGGVGLFLNNTLSFFQYDRTMAIIVYTFIVVIIIDTLSNKIREKLL
ncbi:phosphonate transport system permease protein [Scopulibacillus darangshiensis]|uniref:Phosphonate transport system permease protein n=1 Tax=Scopulibacillus darangshiensis TaxID=442528 RepID=A0A4R2NHG0_9BACL|nr:phosphonate ABC transporter, permease protein PhnE [Scopulibacillus darangshiensis]TCP20853.1 phosphonate transport system permease protein [Scopulibacillus darangshiensis]